MQRTEPELERSATEQLANEWRPRLRDRLRWVALWHEWAGGSAIHPPSPANDERKEKTPSWYALGVHATQTLT